MRSAVVRWIAALLVFIGRRTHKNPLLLDAEYRAAQASLAKAGTSHRGRAAARKALQDRLHEMLRKAPKRER